MAGEKHADQKKDPRDKMRLIEVSVPDIAGQEKNDHGCGKRQEPGGSPDRRSLNRRETVHDLDQPIHHKTGSEEYEDQCDNAGLPGVESAVKKLFADKKGAGADHHQVVQNKGVLERDDADIRLNQIVEEGSKKGDRQILHIYGVKPQKDQYREDCQINGLRHNGDQERSFSGAAKVRMKGQVREHMERVGAAKFIKKKFCHIDLPGPWNRNIRETVPGLPYILNG